MSPVEDDKAALRRRFRATRDALDGPTREAASASICRHLEAFCRSRRIRRVAAFWPLGSEPDLRPLVATRTDWLWSFPRISSTEPPRLVWGCEPLEPGLWGLMEPALAQHFLPPAELLLVPGLAFDAEGHRLGYGKGFYDALLDRLDEGLPALGIGFASQRTFRLPQQPRDQPVHGLVTEQGLEWFGRPTSEA